jgi:hypothetical protein
MTKKREIAAAVAVALFAGLSLGAIISPRPDMPVTISAPGSAWTRTYESPPPENTPIVGYWAYKGERIIFEAVGAGGKWFDWTGRDGPAAVVFEEPPLEWIGQPGAAR